MITLRDYQIPAVEILSKTHRGIVKAPAGSGKTVCAAAALEEWLKDFPYSRPAKVAWVANTNEQVDQGKKAAALFSGIDSWSHLDFFCYAGCPSLAGYDLIIFDECHHLPAPFFRNIVKFHDGARWGISATPDRADEFKKDLYTLIGPIVHTVERAPLVEAGQITEARVFIHSPNINGELEREIAAVAMPEFEKRKRRWPFLFRTPKASDEQKNRCIWQAALDIGITENPKRNAKAVELANYHIQKHDSVLLLVGKIEHGQKLHNEIPGSVVVYSKMGAKNRREAISEFGKGNILCMIATSLADEGLDVPRANVLIQVSGGRSAAKAELQSRAAADPTVNPEDLLISQKEIKATNVTPNSKDLTAQRNDLVEQLRQAPPEEQQGIQDQIGKVDSLLKVDPENIDSQYRPDLASGLLKVAHGIPVESLSDPERSAVQEARNGNPGNDGKFFDEKTGSVTKAGTDWLDQVAPKTSELVKTAEQKKAESQNQTQPDSESPPEESQPVPGNNREQPGTTGYNFTRTTARRSNWCSCREDYSPNRGRRRSGSNSSRSSTARATDSDNSKRTKDSFRSEQ